MTYIPWSSNVALYLEDYLMYEQYYLGLWVSMTRRFTSAWHVALGTQALQSLYKWWPWVDLDLFYGKVKLGHLYVLMGKTIIKSFNGGKLAAKDYIDWIILLMKKIWPQWVVCPCPGAIYLYMTTIFKHLLHWNRLANQSQILCGAFLGRGNESLYKWSRSHDQDGRHAHIW